MRMMKNNNNETVMVIGIDHGYGNMKTATRCFPFVKKPMEWWLEYVKWFENLEYLGYSAGEVSFERILTMMLIILGVAGSVLLIWAGIEQYRKIWDDIYKMFFIVSISLIAVLENVIRAYIPINLFVLMLLLNSLIVGIRMYMEKKKFL